MAEREIKEGDTVRVRDYDGAVSEPVKVLHIWDEGRAVISPGVFPDCRYWNVETMELVEAAQ